MHLDFSIVERIGISLTVFLSTFGAVRLFSTLQRHRLRGQEIDPPPGSTTGNGVPHLLYFWTEECVQCRAQEREIERAERKLVDKGQRLVVKKLNAHREKVLTKRLNVMTVPTTVLLNSNGSVVGWNPGLTRAARIVDQFASAL